jgi:hypothetical protein
MTKHRQGGFVALLTRGLAVALVAMTVAGTAQAQTEWSIGVTGGWSIPTQSANDLYTAGYNIGGTVRWMPADFPVGIQLDGGYHHFNRKDLNTLDLGLNITSLFLNAVFPVSLEASPLVPYLVGGIGLAHLSVEDPRTINPFESTTQMALDLGGGLEFRGWSSVFAPFIDFRLMGVFGSDPRETSYLLFNVGGKLIFGGAQQRGKKK